MFTATLTELYKGKAWHLEAKNQQEIQLRMYLADSICFIVEGYFLLQTPWAHLVLLTFCRWGNRSMKNPLRLSSDVLYAAPTQDCITAAVLLLGAAYHSSVPVGFISIPMTSKFTASNANQHSSKAKQSPIFPVSYPIWWLRSICICTWTDSCYYHWTEGSMTKIFSLKWHDCQSWMWRLI